LYMVRENKMSVPSVKRFFPFGSPERANPCTAEATLPPPLGWRLDIGTSCSSYSSWMVQVPRPTLKPLCLALYPSVMPRSRFLSASPLSDSSSGFKASPPFRSPCRLLLPVSLAFFLPRRDADTFLGFDVQCPTLPCL